MFTTRTPLFVPLVRSFRTCLPHADQTRPEDAGKDGQPDYTMVSTLTKLFRDMNLTIVAEGAETEEDVQNLTEAGVDRIQGYHYARPMNQADTAAFYEKESCSAGGEKCEA